jgi:1-acyl-sn-glycerol-3-phosphate acyltransferase
VSSNGSILTNWIIAETKARFAVIAFFWLCAVIFTIRYEMCGNENVDAN